MKSDLNLTIDEQTGSLPVRGAWIEIGYYKKLNVLAIVAPRKGSVD